MKKYLLSLAVLFAGTAVAQQYKAGDLEYEVIEGEEFLLSKDDMGTTFLTQDSWNFLTTSANEYSFQLVNKLKKVLSSIISSSLLQANTSRIRN